MESTITLVDFLAIPIVGLGLSLIIEFLKGAFPEASARLITVIVCLIGGSAYWYLADTSYFTSLLGVLGAASTMYGFLVKSEPADPL